MKSTYQIKEAQANFSAVIRQAEKGRLTTIMRHNKAVVYLMSAERLAAISETMEILANPKAMRAIRDVETGRAKMQHLGAIPE